MEDDYIYNHSKHKMFLIILIGIILLIPMISAFNFDNSKSFDKDKGKYGTITIKNNWGLGKTLAEYSLEENTDNCFIDCYAEGKTKLEYEGRLFDELNFKNAKGKNTELTYSNIMIKQNGKWIEYDGEYLAKGNYEWRVEAKKIPNQTIDWIATGFGKDLTDWAWWNTTWEKNQEIRINENNGTKLINYSVLVNITYKSGMQPDFKDIRFTNGTSNIEIPFYLNKKTDSTFAEFYVKVPELSANVNTSIYMYYKNTTAVPSKSNGTNTFIFFDDFSTDTNSSWNIDLAGSCGPKRVANGFLNISSPASACIVSPILAYQYKNTSYIIEANITIYGDTYSGIIGFRQSIPTANTGYLNYIMPTLTRFSIFKDSAGGAGTTTTLEVGNGIPYLLSFNLTSLSAGNLKSAINETDITVAHTDTTYKKGFYGIYTETSGPDNSMKIDYFRVRDYVNRTPTVWLGSTGDVTSGVYFIEKANNYNATNYETESQAFNISIDYNSTLYPIVNVTFYYDNVAYSTGITKYGSDDNVSYVKTLDIPTGIGSKNMWWTFGFTNTTSHYKAVNSTINGVTTSYSNFSICAGVGGDVKFLNFSFKDEEDGTTLNASNSLTSVTYWLGTGSVTKSYNFLNTTVNYEYDFCALPNRTFYVDMTFKFSNPDYPLRTFTYDNQALTNALTHRTLYMLSSTDGIYSAIRVAETSGAAISGVLITYERQINGVWILIGQEITGDDGVTTFWVDPNYQYRFTATKSGYSSVSVIISPSQSQYTITMTKTTADEFVSDIAGIKWRVYPSSGSLGNQTNQLFNVTITSSLANIENCKFELVNASNLGQVFATVTGGVTNSSYCYLSRTYSTISGQKIFARTSVDTTNTTGFVLVDGDSVWIIFDFSGRTPWTYLTGIFSEMRGMSEFSDDDSEADFNRIVFFFLITTILIGVFTFFSGIELSNPGLALWIVWVVVLLASVGGFLVFDSGTDAFGGASANNSIPNQYAFFFIYTMILIGNWLAHLRRSGE